MWRYDYCYIINFGHYTHFIYHNKYKNVQEVIAPKTKIILTIASTISPVSKVVNIPETNPNQAAIANAETNIEDKTITGTKTKITNIEKQITTEQQEYKHKIECE